MPPRTTLTRAVGAALGFAFLGVAVFCLWPVQLGGWTAYAVVDGSSMEPRLSSGDLVITRAQTAYRVGDAVLYESDLLDSNVLHRIVAADGGRFVLRGDNRAANDPEAVAETEVVGRLWLTIPGVGRGVSWLARPLHFAIACFVLVLLLLLGGREVSRRHRRGVDPVPVAVDQHADPPSLGAPVAGRGLLVAGAVALIAFALLAVAAWTHPLTTSRTVVGGYAHTGSFTYEAPSRRGAAYPDGMVTTGQPVFVRLSNAVEVAFDYRFVADRPASVGGEIALDVVLSDGAGWERTLPLVEERPFVGSAAHVEGVLEPRRLLGIVARVEATTGTSISPAEVAIRPRVVVTGEAGNDLLDDTFAPPLTFTLDTVALRLVAPDAAATPSTGSPAVVTVSPLTPRAEGSTVAVEPASLSLAPFLALEAERARSIALIGVLAAMISLALGVLLLVRRSGESEADRIEARYGSRIVRARATIPEGRWVTELDEIEALVRLAELYDRVVLHVVESDGGRAFLVDDGIAVYRYRSERLGPLGTPRSLPAHGR